MSEYNPIVRTFNQVRAAILATTDVPRCAVRPAATLESLIPPERRREFWEEIRRRGLAEPRLPMTPPEGCACLGGTAVLAAVLVWSGAWWALPLAGLPLAVALWMANAAVNEETMPTPARTVGELAVCCTRFPDHKASGYRWSRGDIALKVRLIVADYVGVPVDRVQETTSFVEDF